MADESDVEVALVNAVSAALYPTGTSQTSVPGPDCRIYRGWPNSAALDADLAAGKINVTVFPDGSTSRTTTRYAQQWMGAPAQPTLTVAVNGMSVTFGGTADVGQIAGILVDGISYAYRTQVGDTPQSVTANLASMARDISIVRLSYSTLTIAGAGDLLARVVADAPVQQEVRRQEQGIRVTCWCPTPATRDATAAAIDQSLSGQRFLALPDGTSGRLIYAGTTVFDQSQNARLYRRDLTYNVEYATIVSSSLPSMLFGDLVLNTASTIA
ncbi:MAG TPA: hypothetical protein VKI44_00515 [Acetobacteraceae bacterium]|nr:hypothetical protein [Acetobacteraceae bacterium]